MNGTWSLYGVDDVSGDIATITGWKLTFESNDYTCGLASNFDVSGRVVTSGGRVFGLTAYSKTLNSAIKQVYANIGKVSFEGVQYRNDIAYRALFAGTDDETPPEPTATTTECVDGKVYDEGKKACVAPEDSSLNNDERYRAVRELAYAGQPAAALRVLMAMTEGQSDRVLTYTGFLNRQMGNWEAGIAAYEMALQINPDNILARSYFGQALVLMNETDMAAAQLDEIRKRGGAGTWAEQSLATAILTGTTTTY